MPRTMVALLFALCFAAHCALFAEEIRDEDAALQSFEPIVKKFTDFFQKNPKFLSKAAPPRNPERQAFFISHFLLRRVYYDILRSESIVTPFTAFIEIDTDVADNKPCGNLTFDNKTAEGWADIDEAVRNADNMPCFVLRTYKTGPIRHRFHFQYQARTKAWELSDITYQDGSINGRFMALMGVSSPWFPAMNEPQAISYNKGWIQLFRGR